MSTVSYPHLTIADDGSIRIGDSRYQVLHLAGEHYHYGWSADELLRQHPDLRPEEVYSALTYFYDNYDELVDRITANPVVPNQQAVSRAELLKRQATKGGS